MRRKYAVQLIERMYSSTDTTESVSDGPPREVLADRKAIRQSEFYQAAASGFQPEITFVLWSADYQGEDRLGYDGDLYEVIRRYPHPDDIHIELVCQRVNDVNHDLTPLRDGF